MRNAFTFQRLSLLALLLTLAAFISADGATPLYDFDGDGRADFAVRRLNGVDTQLTWFILQSRDGFLAQQWGHQTIHGGDGQILPRTMMGTGNGTWRFSGLSPIIPRLCFGMY